MSLETLQHTALILVLFTTVYMPTHGTNLFKVFMLPLIIIS